MDPMEIGLGCGEWIHVTRDSDHWWAVVDTK